jgi:hypothetical protein
MGLMIGIQVAEDLTISISRRICYNTSLKTEIYITISMFLMGIQANIC